MSTQHNHEAIADRDAYSKALIRNDLHTCVDIEQRYGLYGYSPELVSVGLNAACEGKDPQQAADDYIEARVEEDGDYSQADEWDSES